MFEDVQKDNEELDRASTEQPVAYDSSTLDFGIQGLLQASVEEAEHVCVRELTNRIESHLHQNELQADLRQNNVYIPFSENRKKMIHDMDNVECFQLLRNRFTSAMLLLSILLDKRYCTLYLWNLLVSHG